MTTLTPQPIPLAIRPPSTCLMGEPGSGKTFSLLTFLKRPQITGLFVLGTEPGFVDTLLDAAEKLKVDTGKLHWHYVPTSSEGFTNIKNMAQAVGARDFKEITQMKSGGAEKKETQQFFDMIKQVEEFTDDRTGESFGNIYNWGPDKVFVIDSLSGINETARLQTVGYKPTMDMGEWGIAMNLQAMFINKMKSDLKCFFVLTAHLEREENETTGVRYTTISALGKKNAPRILKDFGEIVLAKRGKTVSDFRWSTTETGFALKNRGLPMSDSLLPDFSQLVDAYNRRLQQAGLKLPPGAEVPKK